jgi:hypothetical protein
MKAPAENIRNALDSPPETKASLLVVQNIISEFHRRFVEDRLDDSDHIRNIKTILRATDHFAQTHPETIEDPAHFRKQLYEYARTLWLSAISKAPKTDDENGGFLGDHEYLKYYFDYLYHHGVYPR